MTVANMDINISSQIRKNSRVCLTDKNSSGLIGLLAACDLIKDDRLRNGCVYYVLTSLSGLLSSGDSTE